MSQNFLIADCKAAAFGGNLLCKNTIKNLLMKIPIKVWIYARKWERVLSVHRLVYRYDSTVRIHCFVMFYKQLHYAKWGVSNCIKLTPHFEFDQTGRSVVDQNARQWPGDRVTAKYFGVPSNNPGASWALQRSVALGGSSQVSYGLQLQPLWRIPTAALG